MGLAIGYPDVPQSRRVGVQPGFVPLQDHSDLVIVPQGQIGFCQTVEGLSGERWPAANTR